MRKVIVAAVIAVMLIGGASIAVAQTDDAAEGPVARVAGFIEDVLDGLVSDGTLSEEQATAVADAFDTAREERQAEREARRAERQAIAEQVQAALEDGVITAEELAELPDGPWNDSEGPLADALEDGEITQEELDELRPFGRRGFGRGGFDRAGFGPGAGAFGFSQDAAETTDA